MQGHIRRYQPGRRRRSGGLLGCLLLFLAVFVTCGVTTLILAPRLVNIAAGAVGLQSRGDTSSLFSQEQSTSAPVQVANASSASNFTLRLPDYGSRSFTVDPTQLTLGTGTDTNGATVAYAQISETAALNLCRSYTPLCSNADPRAQNISFDFRPGGVVVYADVNLPELGGISQRVGAVLLTDASGRQLDFVGVDLNGQLYSIPPEGLGAQILELETLANQALSSAAVEIGGQSFTPSALTIDDTTLTWILR